VAKADPEKRFVFGNHLLRQVYCVVQGLRIARAVGYKIPVGLPFTHFLKGGVVGENLDIGIPPRQVPEDVFLDTDIERGNLIGGCGVPREIRFRGRDFGSQLQAFHIGHFQKFLFQFVYAINPGGNNGIHGPVITDIGYKRPGIHIRDGKQAIPV